MQKIISLLLCIAILFSLSVPALASEPIPDESYVFNFSETIRMEIKNYTTTSASPYSRNTNSPQYFEINLYQSNQLTQTVSGMYGGSHLSVSNFCNGVLKSSETINLADRVTKHINYSQSHTTVQYASTRANVGSIIGYITYKPTIDLNTVNRISVYSKLTKSDTETYTIHGKITDTVAVIAGIILSVIFSKFGGALAANALASAIITGVGGSLVGNAIGVAFSEDVSVKASYYDLTGCDYATNRYTLQYPGTARQVVTTSSNYYNQWFYDGFTPRNWKDNALAYWFWCDLFGEEYPLVASYS